MWETSAQHNGSVLIRNELKWKVVMSLRWKSEEIWTFPSGTKNFMWLFYQVLLEEKATVETTNQLMLKTELSSFPCLPNNKFPMTPVFYTKCIPFEKRSHSGALTVLETPYVD